MARGASGSNLRHTLAQGLGVSNHSQAVPVAHSDNTRDELKKSGIEEYYEKEPSVRDYFSTAANSSGVAQSIVAYLLSLLPFLSWIGNYNLQWLAGDLVAGITVGAVVVPQSMAYAQLAELPVEYGLYTSFMGVLIYFFFATSKDITIGPVAVMSLLVGDIVLQARESHPDIPGHVIASALSVIAGGIICFLGLIRWGWIVEVISLSAVSSFVTGAAFTIACGQVPKLMGISGVGTRDGAYLSVIRSLKGLPRTSLDAALGLTALTFLYLIRSGFNYLARKQPQRQKLWFFCNTLRTVFIILLYTLISWLMNIHLPNHDADRSRISIIGEVPRGFTASGKPRLTPGIIGIFASNLPATVIVLLIEHISISKSFGRVYGYQINPSQEMVAIGVTNLLGPFLGSYPATGSFSRTAIKAKAGVRTPIAGVISAVVVLLAIYALPAVFFYIPNAALSAVIIHAVLDLLTPPKELYRFWRTSPLDAVIFVIGVFVIVFSTVEYGIYVTVSLCFAVLLWRLFQAKGQFVGPVRAQTIGTDAPHAQAFTQTPRGGQVATKATGTQDTQREMFFSTNHADGSNPSISVQHPSPGIFVYRFPERLCYLNAHRYLDQMANAILRETRITAPDTCASKGDRMWNDIRKHPNPDDDDRPTFRAAVLDFSSVDHLDLSTVQCLIDVRTQLDRHTKPNKALWHFACVRSPWAKRALSAAGFGPGGRESGDFDVGRAQGIFNVAELTAVLDDGDSRGTSESESEKPRMHGGVATDGDELESGNAQRPRMGVVSGMNYPCIFPDLQGAVEAANIQTSIPRGS